MREMKYLSPTSIDLFYKDRTEFYLRYMAEHRPPRIPQTMPMSIGAAFDAYVKSYMVAGLIGDVERFRFDTIFETQVEPQNRDWGREHGKFVFDEYVKSGALADLMIELEGAVQQPRFEYTIEGRVAHETQAGGVPLLGKPDVYYVNRHDAHVIHDWKVNGYCSKSATSPKKGYTKVRPGNKKHKDAQLLVMQGVEINAAHYLEQIEESWAKQLAIYGWVLGEPIGSKFLTGIEQIVGNKEIGLRVATFRTRISESFQLDWYARVHFVWSTIKSGHIFTDMSREESVARGALLDDYHAAFEDSDTAEGAWFAEATREHKEF